MKRDRILSGASLIMGTENTAEIWQVSDKNSWTGNRKTLSLESTNSISHWIGGSLMTDGFASLKRSVPGPVMALRPYKRLCLGQSINTIVLQHFQVRPIWNKDWLFVHKQRTSDSYSIGQLPF